MFSNRKMLKRPSYIPSKFSDPELTFKWNDDIAVQMNEPEGAPRAIWEPITRISGYAQASLAAACFEWIAWRMHVLTDTTDALNRIEAAWAAVLLPDFSNSLDYEYDDDAAPERGNKASSVIQTALVGLDHFHYSLTEGETNYIGECSNTVALANHVMPKDSGFVDWYIGVLKSLAQHCGPGKNEWRIPRSWFENSKTVPNPTTMHGEWKSFIDSLNSKENPYLK